MPEEVKDAADGGSDKKEAETKTAAKGPQFSSEQQEFIDNLADKIYERAFNKAEALYTPRISKLQEQLDTIQAAQSTKSAASDDASKKTADTKEDKSAKKAKAKEDGEIDVNALLARLEEQENVVKELRSAKEQADQRARDIEQRNKETNIKERFIRSAEKVGFFDIMDVYSLMRGELDLSDDGDILVINPKTKEPRQTADGTMSIDQYLTDFAKAKPHMVRSKSADGGAGSGENRKTETKERKDVPDYAKMPKKDFLELTEQVIGRQYTERQ